MSKTAASLYFTPFLLPWFSPHFLTPLVPSVEHLVMLLDFGWEQRASAWKTAQFWDESRAVPAERVTSSSLCWSKSSFLFVWASLFYYVFSIFVSKVYILSLSNRVPWLRIQAWTPLTVQVKQIQFPEYDRRSRLSLIIAEWPCWLLIGFSFCSSAFLQLCSGWHGLRHPLAAAGWWEGNKLPSNNIPCAHEGY